MTWLLWLATAELVAAVICRLASKSSRLTPEGRDMMDAASFGALFASFLCVAGELALAALTEI